MKHILAPLVLLFCTTVQAQIVAIDSIPAELLELRTLRTAGQKLIGNPVQTYPNVNIYNTDMTVYTTFTIPSPSAGSYNIIGYFTEDLFDNDPSTIEYLAAAYDPDSMSSITWVYREDGTVLFTMDPGSPGFADYMGLSRGPIFNTATGPVMIIRRDFGSNCVLYSLPGVLPCLDCEGNVVLASPESEAFNNTGGLFSFPNPAGRSTTIDYTLPGGATSGTLVLVGNGGHEVRRIGVSSASGRVALDTSALAPGTYQCVVIAVTGERAATQVVLVE